ncbi:MULTISPECIES: HAD family hydrolase [Chromobacterium]|uniref:HAD family hydrolase n=2 Tax=Chromobacterium TaxID=535 RepID=A0ABS3GL58_9NEIS|nr:MULTISPECIES: HAD family hydrolase [Chromobacterium]AXT45443.1 HAD-IB family hydrolase [Chromobacterium rhizoryzae]MBK0414590.1 HAD family hydrolase [Chromobacterium haemolyticum]MBO0415776.1 HAD family hydrolase [Chromobacterium haemolyticum]MBO0499036.1 HAD family hydrolase [Chromobacterium haemolyticum]OQS37918.1 phosphoserine phosphatase [Chromobacterium haemolyticum]
MTNTTALRNLALFDLDHTLIAGDSDFEWPRFLIQRGILEQAHYDERNNYFYQQYQQGTLDIHEYLAFALEPLKRFSRAELDALHADYLEQHIKPIITRKARDLLAAHAAQGDEIIIITATNRFITGPIARELGVEHLIAIELEEEEDGRFTGRVSGVPSFQEGKITRLQQWLDERGLSMNSYGQSFFYSDSHNDLPLLKLVDHPVAVDPDDTLRAYAEQQDWRVISLRD